MTQTVKSDEHGIGEQFSDALHGRDEPMEVAYPGASPTLVMGTYPIILILGIIVALTYFTLFRQNPKDPTTPQTNQTETIQTKIK